MFWHKRKPKLVPPPAGITAEMQAEQIIAIEARIRQINEEHGEQMRRVEDHHRLAEEYYSRARIASQTKIGHEEQGRGLARQRDALLEVLRAMYEPASKV